MPLVNIKGVGDAEFPEGMSVDDIRAFLKRKYAQEAVSGEASINLDPRQATAQAYTPTMGERIGQGIGNALYDSGIVSDMYGAQRIGDNVGMLGEFLPVIGDASAGDEFGTALAGGDGIGMAMAGLGAIPIVGDVAKKGLKVYHGTPFKYDKPNLDNYASGEGGEGFGYGFHTTASPRTADNYATDSQLIEINGVEHWANQKESAVARKILDDGYDKALADAKNIVENKVRSEYTTGRVKLIESLKDADIVDKSSSGVVKEFSLSDADLNSFIDFDAPITEQGAGVSELLSEAGISTHSGMTGKEFYYDISEDFGGGTSGDKEASEFLESIGIKGIRYDDILEGQYKGDANKYSNYTIFDPSSLDSN
jgi:hypothetical protein